MNLPQSQKTLTGLKLRSEELDKLNDERYHYPCPGCKEGCTLFISKPRRDFPTRWLKIQKATGIKRSPARVWAWMKRHGFRYLKTGHIPAKADDQKQKGWVTQTLQPAIQAARKGTCHLLLWMPSTLSCNPFFVVDGV